jgi:hypothetical protein
MQLLHKSGNISTLGEYKLIMMMTMIIKIIKRSLYFRPSCLTIVLYKYKSGYDINNYYRTGCWEHCLWNGKNHHHTRAGKEEATMAGLLGGRLHFPMRRTRSLTVGMQVCSGPATTQITHATRHYCWKSRITQIHSRTEEDGKYVFQMCSSQFCIPH